MKENQTSLLYNIDDIPPLGETLILGFQHYFPGFVGHSQGTLGATTYIFKGAPPLKNTKIN